MNKQHIQKILNDDIEFLKSLTVEEYTLYKKWEYLNSKKFLTWYSKNKNYINKVKRKIWIPKNINDFENLNIEIVPVENNEQNFIWKTLRTFISTFNWIQSPGRNKKFIVTTKTTTINPFLGTEMVNYKYLGIICLSSDFRSIGNREEVIGWNILNEQTKNEKLKHTAIGSTIVSTQPFGYNYLGGKLISLMTCSDVVEKSWNETYNNNLVGITTTSLYGGFSQYNNLKYWKKLKSSEGLGSYIEPSIEIYSKMRNHIKKYYPDEYPNDDTKRVIISRFKNRLFQVFQKKFGVEFPKSGYKRGVYWCPLYKNTHEFLRDEIPLEKLERKFDNSVSSLVDIWKDKYASKRIKKISERNNVTEELLFYDDIIGLSWLKTRDKYIKSVGR